MVVYILLFLLLFFLSVVELCTNGIPNYIKIFLIILLTCLLGFRDDVGNDYHNYVDIFNHLDWHIDNIEPGFYYLCYYTKEVGLSHQFVFLICSMLTLYPIAFVVNKVIPKYFCTALSVYVFSYIFFEAMNTVRQAVAMSFFLLAFYYYSILRNIYKSLFAILLGFLFHKTILIIALIGYIIYRFRSKIGVRFCIFALILSFVIGISLNSYVDYLKLISSALGYDIAYFDSIEKRGVSGGTFQIYLNLTIFYILLFKRRLFSQDNNISKSITLCYIYAVFIYNIFISFYIGLRFYWYFYIFLILLIPELLKRIRLKYRPLYFVAMVFIMIIYTYVSLKSQYYIEYNMDFNLF